MRDILHEYGVELRRGLVEEIDAAYKLDPPGMEILFRVSVLKGLRSWGHDTHSLSILMPLLASESVSDSIQSLTTPTESPFRGPR